MIFGEWFKPKIFVPEIIHFIRIQNIHLIQIFIFFKPEYSFKAKIHFFKIQNIHSKKIFILFKIQNIHKKNIHFLKEAVPARATEKSHIKCHSVNFHIGPFVTPDFHWWTGRQVQGVILERRHLSPRHLRCDNEAGGRVEWCNDNVFASLSPGQDLHCTVKSGKLQRCCYRSS